jgi:hypothetical protein
MANSLIGVSPIMHSLYLGHDIEPLWKGLVERVTADPNDAGALMDLSVLLQARGQRKQGLDVQRDAIALQSRFRRIYGTGGGLKVAALVAAGDLMANTPIDFLLEGSDVDLTYLYVDGDTVSLPDMSPFNVVFMAVGESEENRPVLANIEKLLAGSGTGPAVMNGHPARVIRLTREGVGALLSDLPGAVVPPVVAVSPEDLLPAGGCPEGEGSSAPVDFPITIRPTGTHAGGGLERIGNPSELAAYFRRRPSLKYHVAPFIDYAGSDGRYRKQRIVFIDSRPFASHLAVSEHWIVHYLSAGMAEHAWRRAEERRWMETFDTDFAVRHRGAFEALCSRIGLDYFGIDCAEMPDGRLLVFEVDVAMIVHDMDPEDVFPYKKPAMRKLFAAFRDALAKRSSADRHIVEPYSSAGDPTARSGVSLSGERA